MNVLLAQRNIFSSLGGAERSLLTLGRFLSGRGHRVRVLHDDSEGAALRDGPEASGLEPVACTLRPFAKKPLKWPDRWSWARQWRSACLREMRERRPDLVLTQLDMAPPTVAAARRLSVPSVLFVRSFEHICPREFQEGLESCKGNCWRCLPLFERYQYPWMLLVLRSHAIALKRASLVVANSRFTRGLLLEKAGVQSEVVYPFIELGRPPGSAGPPPGRELLMVTPRLAKGVRTVLELARRMPDERFLLVGELDARVGQDELPKNVSYIGPVADMGPVYSRARVLLAPSTWPEPFGRVVIEAGALGIPSVVSRVGGLPEALGKGGLAVRKYRDAGAFEEALRKVLSGWEGYSRLAVENARRFAGRDPARRLGALLGRRLGLEA
ncbi:MAG: glycosyltransferase family 4 protein [Euryarchaeota archaeon]|nr:glycosyltransferase family 4 protein [Euryarchaeota archaeon]